MTKRAFGDVIDLVEGKKPSPPSVEPPPPPTLSDKPLPVATKPSFAVMFPAYIETILLPDYLKAHPGESREAALAALTRDEGPRVEAYLREWGYV